MITGKDIIYISTIEWTFLWQVHQEIAIRLAAAGNRVLYVENMGIRAPRLSDAARIVTRLKSWAARPGTKRKSFSIPNVRVVSPLVLPPFGSGLRRRINRQFFLNRIRKLAVEWGMRDPLIWTYLPTDVSVDLIRLVRSPASLIIYYRVADFAMLTEQRGRLQASESELLDLSDVVFASCSQLVEQVERMNQHVYLSPHGVNLTAFPLPYTGRRCPPELANLARPIIGYVGGLHRHVDVGLLKTMASLRPEWSWVFVGSIQTPISELQSLPNTYFLGQKDHAALVDYVAAFDVCIVPYANTELTATVLPTKINEYLAVGKPVVATDIPAVCEFNEEHGVLLLAPGRPAEFLVAIEKALIAATDDSHARRRRETAELADWDRRLESISKIIEEHLAMKL